MHVVVHRGSRHDLGNPGGYLKAAVDFALERDDYGPELRRWLVERLGLGDQTDDARRASATGERRTVRSVEEQQAGWPPPRWRRDRCGWPSPRRRV